MQFKGYLSKKVLALVFIGSLSKRILSSTYKMRANDKNEKIENYINYRSNV